MYFFYFSMKTYFVGCHYKCLNETLPMLNTKYAFLEKNMSEISSYMESCFRWKRYCLSGGFRIAPDKYPVLIFFLFLNQSLFYKICFYGEIRKIQLTLIISKSRSPRDSLKYFEISVHRYIRVSELRKKLIKQPYK